MSVTVALDSFELALLRDLLRDYRDGVADGEVCGFDQSTVDELADADRLLAKLDAATRSTP